MAACPLAWAPSTDGVDHDLCTMANTLPHLKMTLPMVARLKRTSSVTALRQRLGVPPRPHDRYLLEDVIFPALRREPNMVRIPCTGCAWLAHTASYADRSEIAPS